MPNTAPFHTSSHNLTKRVRGCIPLQYVGSWKRSVMGESGQSDVIGSTEHDAISQLPSGHSAVEPDSASDAASDVESDEDAAVGR
jgi:hypothetical protein